MRLLLTIFVFSLFVRVSAQETSPFSKFGKITAEHLQKKVYSIDSNASAIVLSDVGQAAVEGNSKGWFSISFKRHRVVHILNKNGYDEANVEIGLYKNNDDEEKMESIKAVTYNLENGKLVESKLEKSAMFSEKVNKNLVIRKFTFPNVKEGCIIEYEYKVVSDWLQNLDPWYFQGSSPVLWSEYKLSVPQFFTYAFYSHGYHKMHSTDRKDRTASFNIADTRTAGATERYSFSSGVTDYRWVMKDIPQLKEESFTSSVKNHISRIEFQLSSQNYPLQQHDYRNTWTGMTKELLNSPYFGNTLDNNNVWLSDEVKPLLAGATSEKEKAKKIFAFVRDHFSCTDHSSRYAEGSLKNIMKAKKGNVAEINLLLTAMLRYAGLVADPVLLSRTGYGYATELYPLITSFNYVVVQCMVEGKPVYLDASRPRLGFGKLMPDCYNGHARVINAEATPVYLLADSLKEKKVTAFFITNDEKGKWTASIQQTCGFYESYNVREKIKEKMVNGFFKDLQKEYPEWVRIKSPKLDSLDRYEEPLGIKYDMELDPGNEDVLYVNPLFAERWKNNPFKSAERYYPVEMPYTIDEIFLLTMEVPKGYVVDELPKQIIAKLDEDESGIFEYRITQSGNTVSLRCSLKIRRTTFTPDEYVNLREFFNLVVNKQNEQVVFKKKS